MKKSFLFAILAIFLAGAGFGGISMAETTDTESETSTESTTCTENCEAQIGDAKYATLADAIKVAQVGQDITLLKDIKLETNLTVNKFNIVLGDGRSLDLNGNNITFSEEKNTGRILVNGEATIEDTSSEKKGLIESSNGVAIEVNRGGKLSINANVTAQEFTILVINGGNLTVNGGTYTAKDNCVIGTNGLPGKGGNTININGGTFDGKIQSAGYIACGIYAPNDDTITVNGGTFNITNGVGVAIRAGKVTISDQAEFNVTGDSNNKGKVGDSRVVIPAGTKVAVDLAAKYPGLSNDFSVNSKKNNKENNTMNQLYIIEEGNEEGTAYADADDIELTKKSGENKVEFKRGTFSDDVSDYTADGKCSIKNDDGKYEVKDCPTASETFVTSKGTKLPIVYDENKIIKLAETQALFKKKPAPSNSEDAAILNVIKTAEELTGTEIVEIESEDVLFFDVSAAIPTKKQTKAFRKSGSILFSENAFKDGLTDTGNITYDIDKAVNPTWVTPNIEKVTSYNTVSKDTEVIGYMLNMDGEGDGWFYAPRMYKVTFDSNGDTEYEAQKVGLTGGKATNPGIPTKEGSGFKFWSLSNDEESATEYDFNTVVTGDITLYAMYGDDAFTITWKNGNDIINTGVFASGVMPAYVGDTPSKDADSTCNTYEFKEWNPSVTAVTGETTYTATFTCTSPKSSKSSGGSGGGGSSKTSTTNDTKAETGSQNNIKNDDIIKTNGDENGVDNNESTDSQTALDDGFTQEFHDAYDFAFKNGITTMPSIAEADMNGTLTRIAMAKMLSQYAINVLGKTPDTGKNISFPDVSPELDAQYNSGVTLAYQLGIMGINIDEFRPFDEVTRAEFVTALSRMLFGLADGENLYYETHMQKLLEEKIITVADPDMKELRGYVMIMLMRSANK